MASTKTVNYPVIGGGSVIPVSIDVVSTFSIETAINAKIKVTIPVGLSYSSSVVSKGTYNTSTQEWRIATINPGEEITGTFSFLVTDAAQEPFTVTFSYLNPPLSDGDTDDNVLNVVISGVSCHDIVTLCLDGSTTDTMAWTDPADGTVTHTAFDSVAFSFPAGSEFVQSNTLAGVVPGNVTRVVYNTSNEIIGAKLIDGTEIVIPSGVSNPTLTNNGNGTLTWNDQNGGVITFSQGWTTAVDNGDGTFTFTYPSGATSVLTETVTSLVDNLDGTATFTNEVGATNDINFSTAAADGIQTATNNSTDLTCYVRYFGTTAPSVTKIGTGNYRVTLASGTKLLSLMVVGDNTNTSSDQLDLKILDNNGDEVYLIYEVISETSNTVVDKYSTGHLCTYTSTATNEINHAIPNLAYGATGFRLLMTPVVKPT